MPVADVYTSEQVSLDPMSQENIRDPFALFERLRHKGPVYWNDQYSFWMVSGYDEVKSVLQDVDDFSSATEGAVAKRAEGLPASSRTSFEIGKRFFHRHLQTADAPVHTLHRRAVMRGFMPLVTGVVKQSLENRVDRLIDVLIAKGSSDFVADFAYPLPSLVIFDLLGVSEEDHSTIRDTAELFWQFPAAVYRQDVELLDRIATQALCAEAVILRLLEERRISPKVDLISALARPEAGEDVIPDGDIVVMCIFLLMAGHETTANLLSGSILHLLQEREQWTQLLLNPLLVPGAVEELLRFVSPVLWVPRVVRHDVQLGGHRLSAGQEVRVSIGAANHDPKRFVLPEKLVLSRSGASPVAFGYGLHSCLGAALARMEASTALKGLLRRTPGIRLQTETVEYAPIYFLRALKSLPIAVGKS